MGECSSNSPGLPHFLWDFRNRRTVFTKNEAHLLFRIENPGLKIR